MPYPSETGDPEVGPLMILEDGQNLAHRDIGFHPVEGRWHHVLVDLVRLEHIQRPLFSGVDALLVLVGSYLDPLEVLLLNAFENAVRVGAISNLPDLPNVVRDFYFHLGGEFLDGEAPAHWIDDVDGAGLLRDDLLGPQPP